MSTANPTPVSQLMTATVQRVRADAPAEAAWLTMQQAGIHHLLVTEGDELAGIISARDLGDERGAERRRHRLVRDLMSAPVQTIAPTATAAEAAGRLRNRGLSALVVTTGDQVVGILTVNDLLALVEGPTGADAAGADA